MKKLTIAFMVAMAFMAVGCKKKGGGDAANAMAKMKEFRDEMCKCKDAKCAQDVSDKMTKWGQEQSKNQKEPPKMNGADTAEAQKIGKEMGECMTKAMGAGGAMGGGDMAGSAGSGEMAGSAAGSGGMAGSAGPPAGGSGRRGAGGARRASAP